MTLWTIQFDDEDEARRAGYDIDKDGIGKDLKISAENSKDFRRMIQDVDDSLSKNK